MSDPRMIPADDAQVTLDVVNHAGGYGFSFPDTYVRDLAHTVIQQAAQIKRLQAALHAGVSTYMSQVSDLIRDGHITAEDMEGTDC